MRTVALGLLLSGCAAFGGSEAPRLTTEVVDFTIWQTRGATVGFAAQRYCVAGSERERAWMREAVALRSYPAVVIILCRPEPLDGVPRPTH